MKLMYNIEVYQDEKGKSPFEEWLTKLRDKIVKAKILKRIDRASVGDFGDHKPIKGTNGIYEMREHYGPGYRIFYTIVGKEIILFLAGSSKGDQDRTINKAKTYLANYKRSQ